MTIHTKVNPKAADKKIVYLVDGRESSSTLKVDSSRMSVMDVKVQLVDSSGSVIASLQMEPVDFVWNHPAVNQPS